MQSEGDEKAERYRSGGLFSGVVGLLVVVALLVYGLVSETDGFGAWVYPLLLLVGVLCWAILLRPAVLLHRDEIELRNVLHTRWIPFGRIDQVQVGQVTSVHADERRYVGSGFGRSRLTINRDARAGEDSSTGRHSLGWLVEEKIHRRMRAEGAATGPVRRTWAWPEIVALVVLTLATLVTALVA